MRTPRRGFSLVELLVVVAILAILAAILFPIFHKARGKARQASCISQQRQIAQSMLMYIQDNEECLPPAQQWAKTVGVPAKMLTCPMKQKLANGFVFNNAIAEAAVGEIVDPEDTVLVGDGRHVATQDDTATRFNETTFDNVAYDIEDFDLDRHDGNVAITAFVDGHVAANKDPRPFRRVVVWDADGFNVPDSFCIATQDPAMTFTATFDDAVSYSGKRSLKVEWKHTEAANPYCLIRIWPYGNSEKVSPWWNDYPYTVRGFPEVMNPYGSAHCPLKRFSVMVRGKAPGTAITASFRDSNSVTPLTEASDTWPEGNDWGDTQYGYAPMKDTRGNQSLKGFSDDWVEFSYNFDDGASDAFYYVGNGRAPNPWEFNIQMHDFVFGGLPTLPANEGTVWVDKMVYEVTGDPEELIYYRSGR